MKVIERSIEHPSRSDVIRIKPIGDVHLGHANCDEKLLMEDIERVKTTDLAYWIGMGDMAEWINRSDPRHRESHLASWLYGVDDLAHAQKERLIELFSPIGDKCLGLVRGTHEVHILRKYERDVYMNLVEALKPSQDVSLVLRSQGFIILRIRRISPGQASEHHTTWTVVIYCHHGFGGGQLEGSHALALGRLFKSYDCDIALLGHRHVTQAQTQMQLRVTPRGKIVERHQVATFTGSYLRSYGDDQETYAEEMGYRPLPVGSPELLLWPATRRIQVVV